MKIDEIKNGIVIDHIQAGSGKKIYELLELDSLDCSVALLRNVYSEKLGKKDIIKIDRLIDLDMDVIGFVDPKATIVTIRDGKIIEKKTLDLPKELVNVIYCKNPRCISQTEQELKHIFRLTNHAEREYRCIYCETEAK